MRKMTLGAMCLSLLLTLMVSVPAAAQTFSAPVPGGSTENQVQDRQGNRNDRTKFDGTHLKFFSHPQGRGENYSGPTIQINGSPYLIDDLVATPGLRPGAGPSVGSGRNSMIDFVGVRTPQTLNPLEGFCPEKLKVTSQTQTVTLTLDCQIFEGGGDRQLEVADIRNSTAANQFQALFGGRDPLVDGVLGSAHEDITPYSRQFYPATVMSAGGGHWPGLATLSRLLPIGADASYDEVIAYDIADLGDGVVTAAYDPIELIQNWQLTFDLFRPPNTRIGASQVMPGTIRTPFLSPLVFFRKDHDAGVKRLRLAGLSTIQFPEDLTGGSMFTLLAHNFNPIAVEPMRFLPLNLPAAIVGGAGRGGLTGGLATAALLGTGAGVVVPPRGGGAFGLQTKATEGFAVVNQATLLNLDNLFVIDGRPYVDPVDGETHPWRDILGVRDQRGQFAPLDPQLMPHRVVSYVIFWGKDRPWGGILNPDPETFNPNSVFGPFGFALIGPGAFDAIVAAETIGGDERDVLFIPAGEAGANGEFYVHKVDPLRSQVLFWRSLGFSTSTIIQPIGGGAASLPRPTTFLLPEHYPVDVPQGFAPYKISSADIDGDGCSEIALTFRGREIVPVDVRTPFQNAAGQNVVFQVSSTDRRMFASVVQVHRGSLQNGRCTIERRAWVTTPSVPNDAQIATAALGDVDGNGGIDLLVGDVVPRQIPAAERNGGEFTSYASLYRTADPQLGPDTITPPLRIRLGYNASATAPTDAVAYVRGVTDGSLPNAVLGAADLGLNRQVGQGANIGAINGLPLALPPMGCPAPTNTEVASVPEMYWSTVQNLLAFFRTGTYLQQVREALRRNWPIPTPPRPLYAVFPFSDAANANLFRPQRCGEPAVCRVNLPGSPNRAMPFWADDPCCNPCDPDPARAGDEWAANSFCKQALCGSGVAGSTAPYQELCTFYNGQCSPCTVSGVTFPAGHACCQNICNPACVTFITATNPTNANLCNPTSPTYPQYRQLCTDLLDKCPCGVSLPNGTPLQRPDGTGVSLPPRNPCCSQLCGAACSNFLRSNNCADPILEPICRAVDGGACGGGVIVPPGGLRPGVGGGLIRGNNDFFQQKKDELIAEQSRCDEVYDSRGHYIADVRDLTPAQSLLSPPPSASPFDALPSETLQAIDTVDLEILRLVNADGGATFEGFILDQLFKVMRAGEAVQPRKNPDPQNSTAPLLQQNPQLIQPLRVNPVRPGASLSPIRLLERFTLSLFDAVSSTAHAQSLVQFPPSQRLPRGQVMPGPHEIIAVVNTSLSQTPGCNLTGPLTGNARCNQDPANACPTGQLCGIDCQCHNECGRGPLDPGEQCNRDNPCADGNICNIDCQCIRAGGPPTPPQPPGAGPLESAECHAIGFSNEGMQKEYERLNSELRTITGLRGDMIGQPEFTMMQCIACMRDAAAPGVAENDIARSFSGAVLPGVRGNVRPWVLIQRGGSALVDFTSSIYRPAEINTVASPVRVLPLEAGDGGAGKSLMLPDLSTSARFAALPAMSESFSVQVSSSGPTTRLNNVLQHRVEAVPIGGSLSVGSIAVNLGTTPSAGTSGYACHIFSFRIGPDIASWTGTTGAPTKPLNIEDRKFNFEELKAELQSRKIAAVGRSLTSNDLQDLQSWEENMNWQFVVAQAKLVAAGQPAVTPEERGVVFLGGYPYEGGRGAGCLCSVSTSPPTVGELISWMLLAVALGIGWRRLRASVKR